MSDSVSLVLILASLGAATASFIWVALRLGNPAARVNSEAEMLTEGVEHIFDDEFREELRNQARLHFEKIVSENAMFLQQDLRLTTLQLNEYMKTEITRSLSEAFAKYEESITAAKQMAVDSIEKTRASIDEQRQVMNEQLTKEVATEKQHLMQSFETNMGEIINHYVLAAVGNQLDLNNQLEYILGNLEANKKAILEDIQKGA